MSQPNPFDFDEDDDDRPRRRRRNSEDEYRDDRPRRRGDSLEDDYDDRPPGRRRADPGQGLAIASMIVGIVAVVSSLFLWCCCSFFGSVVSVLVGGLAVLFGFVARSQGSRSGMALAGIITGFAAIAIGVILTTLLAAGFAFMKMNPGGFGPGGPGGGGGPAGGPGMQRKAL